MIKCVVKITNTRIERINTTTQNITSLFWKQLNRLNLPE